MNQEISPQNKKLLNSLYKAHNVLLDILVRENSTSWLPQPPLINIAEIYKLLADIGKNIQELEGGETHSAEAAD